MPNVIPLRLRLLAFLVEPRDVRLVPQKVSDLVMPSDIHQRTEVPIVPSATRHTFFIGIFSSG